MTGLRAPRVYNLFPLLAGSIETWERHLPRIAGMGFDWVFLNPFHAPGFSGSLYAIKDIDRLHPAVAGDGEEAWDRPLARFCEAAGQHGLSVMVDLVINHTAKDSRLVEAQPDWFQRDADGSPRSPRAVDPADPRSVTVWGDLAALDYERPKLREAQIAYWSALVRRYLAAGVRGFRCDAAYQVPVEIWRPLISAAKRERADAAFAAETLGCSLEEAESLAPAGFDLLFNSAKWWDFRAPWLLGQYERLRRIAPSVAFPESHDTPRLIAELGTRDPAEALAAYRFAYAFAASFSAGVMIPMGFEYGFSQPLDVKATRPGQWDAEYERRPFDLTGFIADMNALKAAIPTLGEEGPQRRISAPDARYVALERRGRAGGRTLALLNSHSEQAAEADPAPLARGMGSTRFVEVTPGQRPVGFAADAPILLPPRGFRLFEERGEAIRRERPSGRKALAERLAALAENRIAIEKVTPQIDGGRFPVKRIIGDVVTVEADIFADGHEKIAAALQYRPRGARSWRERPMTLANNDRWRAALPLEEVGRLDYRIAAWRDRFATLIGDVTKKADAGQDIAVELVEASHLLGEAAAAAEGDERTRLLSFQSAIAGAADQSTGLARLLEPKLARAMAHSGLRTDLTISEQTLSIAVDRPQALFSAWYEMFPRSQSGTPGRHGTFRDVIAKLDYVRDLGFDVLYFPPIHPIGKTNRKGRNNALTAGPDDPGSVYAIGGAEGGHTAIHPALGTLEDFRELVAAAREKGLEIALDIAIQCSPDHPWLDEHPEWFDWRPDGTIKYAENPPKTYEDIVNVHFYRDAIPALWFELKSVFEFWVAQGVTIFRVDNPHTKPFPFWEWLIGEIKAAYPETIFLSEAFTRPKVMMRLAKLGFTQSYTYFTWRTEKAGMAAYLEELASGEAAEAFRPNFFVNTPDINPRELQSNERPAYIKRLVLAATLSGSWGMYNGFEICEGTPVPGKEEYLDSEKYEIKAWDLDRPGHIKDEIRKVNAIRRDNPALWTHLGVTFLNAWNDNILYYLKMTEARDSAILVMVNMDHRHPQETDFEVPLWEFGLPDAAAIEVEDLMESHSFTWQGKIQHIRLDPAQDVAKIWRLIPPGRRQGW